MMKFIKIPKSRDHIRRRPTMVIDYDTPRTILVQLKGDDITYQFSKITKVVMDTDEKGQETIAFIRKGFEKKYLIKEVFDYTAT